MRMSDQLGRGGQRSATEKTGAWRLCRLQDRSDGRRIRRTSHLPPPAAHIDCPHSTASLRAAPRAHAHFTARDCPPEHLPHLAQTNSRMSTGDRRSSISVDSSRLVVVRGSGGRLAAGTVRGASPPLPLAFPWCSAAAAVLPYTGGGGAVCCRPRRVVSLISTVLPSCPA